MKVRVVDRLRCPACRGKLRLRPFKTERVVVDSRETRERLDEEVVQVGVLLCDECRIWYPIQQYVPVMLLFHTRFHVRFAAEHSEILRQLATYRPPDGRPRPGETSVQDTFTEEWDRLQQDQFSFNYTLDDLKALNREVWLRWAREKESAIKSVLNVGVGLGKETEALRSVCPHAEVFGVDLNFALLETGPRLKTQAGLHFVIASLFSLPFAAGSFDLVYSQGVIHHTYSTRDALGAIAAFVGPGGYLFVWVYGLDDHLVLRGRLGVANRAQWRIEALVRPLISRAPSTVRRLFFGAVTMLAHPLVKSRVVHKDRWRWRNTDHLLRDWLSPRYAHRHSYNEILEWYEELGLRGVDIQSPGAYRKLFGKRLWGVGVTGLRVDPVEGVRADAEKS